MAVAEQSSLQSQVVVTLQICITLSKCLGVLLSMLSGAKSDHILCPSDWSCDGDACRGKDSVLLPGNLGICGEVPPDYTVLIADLDGENEQLNALPALPNPQCASLPLLTLPTCSNAQIPFLMQSSNMLMMA